MSNDVSPTGAGDGPKTAQPAPAAAKPWLPADPLAWVFTATTFLSAFLLFSIQPLFAKMVLPILGGAPSVWAVAICFFQGALLAGYYYAHLLNTRVPSQYVGFAHLAIFVLALISLPIGLPAGWREPPPGEPYLWQLGLFTIALGLPFLAVSANAPLLQAWFARTGHPDGRDPYFLYAASNLGSLIALLSYPFVLEPAFGVTALSRFWAIGFLVLGAAIGACFWFLRQAPAEAMKGAEAVPETSAAPAAAPTWTDRLGWIGLALVPAALLTAFTTHVSTDVASAPLLWVLPLSLYLLTFVLVFRDPPLVQSSTLLKVHLLAVLLALLQLAQTKHDTWFVSSATGVLAFFTSGLVAHRTLYEARPAPRYLTEFYLFMSLGGVLGGLFAALIAPKLFSEIYEYPLLLALTLACRPGVDIARLAIGGLAALFRKLGTRVPASWQGVPFERDEVLRLWLIFAVGALVIYWVGMRNPDWTFRDYGVSLMLALAAGAFVLLSYRFPPRQAVGALLMCGAVVMLPSSVNRGDALEKKRSYFGVYRVSESSDGEFNVLTHGTTLHGAQRVRDAQGNLVVDTTPGTYYHPKSPMAKTVEMVRERLAAEGKTGRYGIIGLGSGSLACLSKPDEKWRIFEIDPTVIRIATNPELFSYLQHCQPQPDIVIGDARLTMAKEAPESFDLIIVDAFSSDAVPVHLMTAEALRIYAAKLKPSGVVLLHISNRYLDLDSVVGATAPLVPELHGVLLTDDSSDGSYASTTSTVAVLSKDASVIEKFSELEQASELDAGDLRGWTDDYSDVLGPFLSKMN